MKLKITKSVVDDAEPADRDIFIWDTEAKGYGLKVTPKGRKVYVVQYRLPASPTKRHTIGKHGSPWTPANARVEAKRILGLASAGDDPAAEKRRAKSDIKMAALCERYMVEGGRTKKDSTRAIERRLIGAHIVPLLGRNPVRSITKPDIDRFMRDVANGKTATDKRTKFKGRSIVTGGKSAANRTLGFLGPLFEFAIDEGLRTDNPTRGVKKYKEGRPARFLSNSEIAKVGDALRAAEAAGVNPYALAALRLLMLTGCRKNEILKLRWDEVDFEGGFLRLPDSKTGYKPVPVGAPVLSLLSELPRVAGNPFVIVGELDGGHYVNLQKVWSKVRASGNLEGVRIHDLRHSHASVGARAGQSMLIIGKILGHKTSAATARYAHLSDDPVRAAAEGTSKTIMESLQAGER